MPEMGFQDEISDFLTSTMDVRSSLLLALKKCGLAGFPPFRTLCPYMSRHYDFSKPCSLPPWGQPQPSALPRPVSAFTLHRFCSLETHGLNPVLLVQVLSHTVIIVDTGFSH